MIEILKDTLKEYHFIKISEQHLQDVYALMKSNTYYFEKTQFHEVCLQECADDIVALPPNTKIEQKFYYGLYQNENLIAVLDFIEGYPQEEIIYIGLFMLEQKAHGTKQAQKIISAFKKATQLAGFKKIALGCYENNLIGYRFWLKQGFRKKESVHKIINGHDLVIDKMEWKVER
ncbi:MAG: GNAT family N-acetyltransferase [Erysipelotrichia bacterium]|nr:GNAT family N-acetyltransferase [Erysipelotrichia bacterium]NCC55723.1 GNAT family N-acetyltransferase [Erysipelotrichia bacterium]